MIQTVEFEYEQSILLLERLVNQNSGTMNFADVEAVGSIMRAQLKSLGFSVAWKPITAAKRSGQLIAKAQGQGRYHATSSDWALGYGVRAERTISACRPRWE